MQSVKILDRYIIRKFLGTFFFSLGLIIAIAVVFDISEKLDDFIEKQAPIEKIIFDYYLNFIPYFANLFAPLFVFILAEELTRPFLPGYARALLESKSSMDRRKLEQFADQNAAAGKDAAQAALANLALGQFHLQQANYAAAGVAFAAAQTAANPLRDYADFYAAVAAQAQGKPEQAAALPKLEEMSLELGYALVQLVEQPLARCEVHIRTSDAELRAILHLQVTHLQHRAQQARPIVRHLWRCLMVRQRTVA